MKYEITRRYIDWQKTSKNLQLLRCDNLNLRKYVCFVLKTKYNDCDGSDCDKCKYDMDNRISQAELAEVFNVAESAVANWENGRSKPPLEDLLFYCQICGLELFDILVFA